MARPNSKLVPTWAVVLEKRREIVERSQEEIANDAGFSQAYYSKIARGAQGLTKLSQEYLMGLARALKWTLEDMQQATGIDLGVSEKPSAVMTGFHMVEVLEASAGMPSTYPVPDEVWRRGSRVFKVSGDSMNTGSPDSLQDGEWVLVDKSLNIIQEGKIYCLHIKGNGYTIKRARKLGGTWWLTSDNPKFESFQPDEAEIIGQVYKSLSVKDIR